MKLGILSAFAVLAWVACTTEPADPAFASPKATIDTLFTAYDVKTVPQSEIRRRFTVGERFKLYDHELFKSCFSDWQGEHDEGLGGYVFGKLVAGKDELGIEVDETVARVRPLSAQEDFPPVVLIKQDAGWKIDLRQSVPADVRQRLYEVSRRARRMEQQSR